MRPYFCSHVAANHHVLDSVRLRVQRTGPGPCTLRVTDKEVAVPGAAVWLDGRPVGATNALGSTYGRKVQGTFGFKRSVTTGWN